MSTPVIVLLSVIGIIVGVFLLVLITRIVLFSPTKDKIKQLENLNDDLKSTGFAYNLKDNYFYSLRDCWQREVGYCTLYDEGSPFFNMIMDCEPVTFSYGGKRWLIELWKGQYGITTGAEIGVYNTTKNDIESDKFTGTFYEAVSDDEQIKMSLFLYRDGRLILKRKGYHWWLTAFKLGEFSEPENLYMIAKLTFKTKEMCNAFVNALEDLGYSNDAFYRRNNTVKVYFDKPHSPQPSTQEGIQKNVIQGINKSNVNLFNEMTGKYTDTLDKLEYIKSLAPELYEIIFHSLYAKGFFSAFEWIIKIIKRQKSKPHCPVSPEQPDICFESQPADDEVLSEISERLVDEYNVDADSIPKKEV